MKFVPVTSDTAIRQLACMANSIWHEYWPSRIGADQTDYMVEQYQSLEALLRDIRHGNYEYWILVEEDQGTNRIVGYTGGHVEEETNRFFISKIYLYANERGRGFATRTISFYDQLCAERGLRAMYLTVNKENELALRAYRAKNFVQIDATVSDIGSGFVMDDYIMERATPNLG